MVDVFKKFKTALFLLFFRPKEFYEIISGIVKSFFWLLLHPMAISKIIIIKLWGTFFKNKGLKWNLNRDVKFEFDFSLDRFMEDIFVGRYEQKEIKIFKFF